MSRRYVRITSERHGLHDQEYVLAALDADSNGGIRLTLIEGSEPAYGEFVTSERLDAGAPCYISFDGTVFTTKRELLNEPTDADGVS